MYSHSLSGTFYSCHRCNTLCFVSGNRLQPTLANGVLVTKLANALRETTYHSHSKISG